MVKPKLPVDIYTRVSRQNGREHMRSPEDQEQDARHFARGNRLVVGEVFCDVDHSGGTLDRPGLQKCLRRVESGLSGGVVVSYLSRASRDTVQGLQLLDRITAVGGAVFAPNLPDYTTADGRMLTTIQLAIDEGYRMRKGEEFEKAKRGAVERGIPIHVRPPVGYRARADRRLEPDPRSADTIREVFEMRAAGAGPLELAEHLQTKRVRTSQGSRTWTRPAVYGLLKNRVYLGEVAYGRDRRYVNPSAHEPIVDLATWQAAQNPTRKLSKSRSSRQPYLLSGIARCQACGFCLQGTRTSRGKLVYRCQRRHAGGICPQPARVDVDVLDEAVVDGFWRLVDDISASGKEVASDAQIATLESVLAKTEKRLEQFLSPAVQDELGDTPEWAAGLKQRRRARDEAAETLGRARAEATRSSNGAPTAATLRKKWKTWSTIERREAIAAHLDLVAVGRDDSVALFVRGTGPVLPKPGFRREPRLWPIELPADVRVLAA